MASSVSVAYLYARPPFDPSLAFLSHSNCSLICCDRSNCHHLPTGDQQRRTSVFLCVYHCRQFIYNPIEGTPFVLHLFCCCRPLRILFSGHLLLLRFPLSSFPLPSGRPFLHLLPLLACPTVCYWSCSVAVLHSLISNPWNSLVETSEWPIMAPLESHRRTRCWWSEQHSTQLNWNDSVNVFISCCHHPSFSFAFTPILLFYVALLSLPNSECMIHRHFVLLPKVAHLQCGDFADN